MANFYQYLTYLDANRRQLRKQYGVEMTNDYRKFYPAAMGEMLRLSGPGGLQSVFELDQVRAEYYWYQSKKPYYRFHPRLTPIFSKTKLNFPASYIELPYPIMSVEFAENDPALMHKDGKHRLQSCLAVRCSGVMGAKADNKGHLDFTVPLEEWFHIDESIQHFRIIMDLGERSSDGMPIYTWKQLIWNENNPQSVESIIQEMNKQPDFQADIGVPIDLDLAMLCLKLVVSLCFLAKDESEIIQPHLLKKDMQEAAKASPERIKELHKKAIRERDATGWLVGHEEMFDLGRIGPATTGLESGVTGRHLNWQTITTGHWRLVRYGPKKERGRVRWIMPYARAKDKPFKPV